MKTTISNETGNILEIANQIIYSAKVLAIGLFIPFVFVFGITYHTSDKISKDEISNSKQQQTITQKNGTADFTKFLSMI
jgi:tetrahydromethanopterin S-methyltransferase subunit D